MKNDAEAPHVHGCTDVVTATKDLGGRCADASGMNEALSGGNGTQYSAVQYQIVGYVL
jgi:hypothetical protein